MDSIPVHVKLIDFQELVSHREINKVPNIELQQDFG